MSDQGVKYVIDADVSNAAKNIEDFSKKSRIALTQLSLVAQDLPYGFIGIQNNVPFLVKSFSDLTKESGGVMGAFKALGAELIGPTGVLFAVSAITAGVTALIQKYGSLENAIAALTGNVDKFNIRLQAAQKSYADFNKESQDSVKISNDASASVQGQILKVQTLTEAIKSNTTSSQDKQKAIQELKKVSDAYFGSLSTKAIDLKKLTDITNEYTQALINQAIAKGYEEEIVRTTKELNDQNRLLLDIVSKLPEQYKQIKDLAKENQKYGDFGGGILKFAQSENAIKLATDNVNKKFLDQAQVVSDLNKRLNEYRKLFKDITLQTLPLLEFEDPKGPKAKKIKEDIIGVYFPTMAEWEIEFRKRAKQFSELNAKYALDVLDFKGKQAPGIKQVISPELFARKKQLEDFLKGLESDIKAASALIGGVLLDPLTNMFNEFLNTGKLTFKEFGKVVLENLKKLTAQIVATGIIQLLATIFTGGFGAAAGYASGTTGFQAGLKLFGKAFGSALGFKSIANPSFGGVGPGGLAMSGAVSLSLRGSDLVGAINRTNTNINRIG